MEAVRFLNYLQYEKRRSSHTVRAYGDDLNEFAEYIQQHQSIRFVEEATTNDIRQWLAKLMAEGISARTVKRKISSLQAFYKFLLAENKISENPVQRVSSPKIARKLPVFIPASNLQTLFEEFDFTKDFQGWRDRLMLEMFFCTGMRRDELIQLRHQDIDLQTDLIRLQGKGNKQRLVPMLDSLKQTFQCYVFEKQKLFGISATSPVFVTDKGKIMYPKLVYRRVNFYLSSTTTVSKRSPHVLRHTFATSMLNQGADLNAIKELLGHSSLAATQVYTHNTVEQLKKVYKQAHPKA